MKTVLKKFTYILCFIILSGCASIVSRSSYPLVINSSPSEANISIYNRKGREIYKGTTPTAFEFQSGAGYFTKGEYFIKFEKEGYDTRITPVFFKLDPWYLGNLVLGGFLGLLVIDPLTGAMWKLKTDFMYETLKRTSASIETPFLEIYDYNEIPESWKDNLEKIN